MSSYQISRGGPFIFVATAIRNATLDALAVEHRGKWWGKDRHYSFPVAVEAEVRAAVEAMDVPQVTTPAPTPTPVAEELPSGWSNAARRRAGNRPGMVDSALGRGVRREGHTMYETHEGSGRFTVQIWDES